MVNSRFLLISTLFLSVYQGHATGLSLSEAVTEALSSSPKVERAQSKSEEASWARAESLNGFLPRVDASANYLLEKKYILTDITLPGSPAPLSIPGVVPTSIFTLNAQLPLFDGLANVDRLRAARSIERSAQNDYEWTRFSIAQDVTILFYKALGAKLLKDVAEQNLTTLNDHLKDVTLFKKAGVSTNYDVLRVEVQVSEAKSELMNATDNIEISRSRLAEALGKSVDERPLIGDLPQPNESWIATLDFSVPTERKDLVALEERSAGIALQDTAAGRFWVPKIALYGQYQYYNNRNDTLSDWQNYRKAYQVGINANWNIFDGMTSIARSRQVAEQKVQTEKTLEIARIHSKQELDLWKRKFLYLCSVYRSRQSDVEKVTESVRLAKEGRKAGIRTNTELLDAEAELYRAQAGLLNSQIGALEALSNLESSLGRKIHE